MNDDFQFDVFLCHSAQDKPVVRALAEQLRADGVRVWFDEWMIRPGDNGAAKIEEGLGHARVLVLCLSAHAFGAEWAQLENYTLRFRDPLNQARRFLSVRLDDASMPDSLAQFFPIDWTPTARKQTYAALLAACRPSAPPSQLSETQAKLQASLLSLGHMDKVWSVGWSPDGRQALSGAADNTVRVWEVASGRCLRTLEGHTAGVLSVGWSPDGQQALSGADDNTVRVWEVASGRCLRTLEGHTGYVRSVGWSPDGQQALSGAGDGTVRVWEVASGRCLRTLGGHTKSVLSVGWSPDGRQALSGAGDGTVRVWEMTSGRCLRTLEGHTGYVWSVGWSPDGQQVLSGAADKTVRVWEMTSGRCLRTLEGHTGEVLSVAWSPDGQQAQSAAANGVLRLWASETAQRSATALAATTLAASGIVDQVQYTNAKVLLVGDTGVGKSGLAERLVHGRFVPTKSSHARKADLFDSQIVTGMGGVAVQQEIVLWDLAGQPAYRLVHQLSMEDAALACVLFDCSNETNPFEGAAYWSQVLDQARTNTRVKKLLVAARIDVGGLPSSRERIERFAQEQGFAHFIATSAYTGEGCDTLAAAIRQGIAWDQLPTVTTTATLAALRAYVALLKGEKPAKDDRRLAGPQLQTIAALHEGFCAHFGQKMALEEFIAHLQRLEATDALDLLVFQSTSALPRSEDLVLLDPTRVDAYASALLIAARDEADGPGHLLETRIRQGQFKLDPDERLADPVAERHVLWFVIENLLVRDLALREQIQGEDYLVFPSQCTAELRFPGVATFGVAFGFAGPVRSIYATLIAQLAHYAGFSRREFFHDAAAYTPEKGGLCLIRLRDYGRGQGELEVSFEPATATAVRQGFLEFVSKHLEAKSTPGSVTQRHAYYCTNSQCRNPFEDRVVKARLAANRRDLLCPICEEKTPLVDLLAAPTRAAEAVAAQIGSDAQAGRQRMTAALVIKAKEAEGKYDVFLSHNNKDKPAVEQIAKQLKAVGIRPWLDKWDLAPGDTIMDALERAVKTIPCGVLCFGPADVGKWHIMEIRAYLERWAGGDARLVPVLLPGVKETPELPLFVRQTLWVDLRHWEEEGSDGFYRLVCGIVGRAPGDAPLRKFSARHVAEWQGWKL